MRDTLKNAFNHFIILEDNSQFYYTIKPYDLTNILGNNIAVLQEYDFTKMGDNIGQFSCKLYKTKEGNWYYINNNNSLSEYNILKALKSAIVRQNNILRNLSLP